MLSITIYSEFEKIYILRVIKGLIIIHIWVHNASPTLYHEIFLILNQSGKLLDIILSMPVWRLRGQS